MGETYTYKELEKVIELAKTWDEPVDPHNRLPLPSIKLFNLAKRLKAGEVEITYFHGSFILRELNK